MANTQGVGPITTRVYTYFGFGIPLDVIDGLVRCVHPGIDNHVSFGTALSVGYDAILMQSYMDVEDLEGRVLNAITEYGCDLTVLGNYGNLVPGGQPMTSGHWDDVSYDSLSDTTTFTATFPPHAVNWWLQPDAARSTYLEIVSLSASQVVVEGDATGLAHGLTPQPGPPPLTTASVCGQTACMPGLQAAKLQR